MAGESKKRLSPQYRKLVKAPPPKINAVEIESAVSDLARQPFDPAEFPYQFLAAFDNKEVALKRLRKGNTNASDLPNAVLQHKKIHIAVAQPGQVPDTLRALKASPKTAAAKAKFILSTDGLTLEAEDLSTGEAIAPDYPNFADHFAFSRTFPCGCPCAASPA